MIIFPAIDLIGGCAVRLYKGDYSQKTTYSASPAEVAIGFERAGAKYLHLVDLDAAKNGGTPNIGAIKEIVSSTGLFVELGGGIRSEKVIEQYLNIGVKRVILGSAAVTKESFMKSCVDSFGDCIAVGVDIKDGFVSIHGWTENTEIGCLDMCMKAQQAGVKTVICTDISKDGAMQGTNRELYRELKEKLSVNITASGGVSSIEDITALRDCGLYGAILGKALYTGAVDLSLAIKTADTENSL